VGGGGESIVLRRFERGTEFSDNGGDVVGGEGHCRKLPLVGKWAASRTISDCLLADDDESTPATSPAAGVAFSTRSEVSSSGSGSFQSAGGESHSLRRMVSKP
jgi:hypothetical protein